MSDGGLGKLHVALPGALRGPAGEQFTPIESWTVDDDQVLHFVAQHSSLSLAVESSVRVDLRKAVRVTAETESVLVELSGNISIRFKSASLSHLRLWLLQTAGLREELKESRAKPGLHRGYLFKLDGDGEWKEYYFVLLANYMLVYYADEGEGEGLGYLDLAQLAQARTEPPDPRGRSRFQLRLRQHSPWLLAAVKK